MSGKMEELGKVCEMGDCIIIQNNERDIISDAIEWFSNGKVSHVAMYLGGGQGLVAEFCIEGAMVNKINKYDKEKYTVYVRRIKGITVDAAAKMKDAGYKSTFDHELYGFVSYLGFIIINIARKIFRQLLGKKLADKIMVINNPFAIAHVRVCSTGYDYWAKEGGIDLFPNLGNELVTPEDLLESDKLETMLVI